MEIIKNAFNIGQRVTVKGRPLPPMIIICIMIGDAFDHIYTLADDVKNPSLIISDVPQSLLKGDDAEHGMQLTNTLDFERGCAHAYGNVIDYADLVKHKPSGTLQVMSYAQSEFRRSLAKVTLLAEEKIKT